MAPTQQSTTIAENNSEFATNSTSSDSTMRIEKEHYSSSSSSSSITNNFNNDTHNGINSRLIGTQETSLPISSKGDFFHDDFFKDTRHHFEEAVRNVLNQCGHKSTLHDDDLISYRTLRKSDLSEKSQASTVTEDNTCHKVVIDVHDFKCGDVKVKVVDESEVVVEGSVEQQNGGSVSKKSFRRSFNFPGQIKTEDITSTMSSEGILTVTVPKKETIPKITNIGIQESQEKINKSTDTTKASSESSHEASGSEIHSHQTSTLTSSQTTSKNLLTKDSKENQTSHENNSTKKSDHRNSFPVQSLDLLLPISQSGSFFQDTFFTEAHQEFEEAMRKVLKSEGESTKDDVVTSYRSLRERNLTDDNQAVSITEDTHQHKVVMDVKDFMRGDVKVKVVNEDKVVVEGTVEQENGGLISKKTFHRSFTFPGLVKAADITSTMSSDGVLIVTIPKKESIKQFSDIKIQESDKKTNMSTETTKRSSDSKHEASETQSHQTSTLASTQTTSTNLLTKDNKVNQTSDINNSTKKELNCKKSTSENGSSVQSLDLLLPISQTDSSFQDTFFTQAHQEFEEAMRKVLKSEGESTKDDVVTSYRSLRERNLTDDNRAVSITEDTHQHKVVMDVRDFMDGGVRVKVVDEDQLVVESSMEQQNGMSMSKKSFQRSFTFPGLINAEAVTSTLSTDGILTIRIHKKKQLDENEVKTKKSTNTTKDNVTTSKTDSSYSINASSKITGENRSKTSVDTNESCETESLMRNRTSSGDKEDVESNCSFESTTTNHSHRDAATKSSWVLDSLLPVFPKGPFFHDSYFKESRQHFETAVKEALNKFDHEESHADDLSRYWNLRTNDLTNENKAVKVTENEHIHQVVLDVNDFKDGDIKVKVVGKSQIQVEGKVEKNEGGCTSSKTFSKCFNFPGVVDADAVTSALSSDGILTIKAPKGGVTTIKGSS